MGIEPNRTHNKKSGKWVKDGRMPSTVSCRCIIIVLRAGHARLACEVNGDVGRQQQEPSERAA